MISDLLAFVNARLDEKEALANRAEPWPWGSDPATAWIGIPGPNPLYVWAHMTTHDPRRVLREVAADRDLIAAYQQSAAISPAGSWESDYTQALERAVRIRATVYSNHLDYRREWALEGSSDAR